MPVQVMYITAGYLIVQSIVHFCFSCHLTGEGMVVVFRNSTDKPMLNKELMLLSSEYRNLETLIEKLINLKITNLKIFETFRD